MTLKDALRASPIAAPLRALRERYRSASLFLRDPTKWTERHQGRMNEVFAERLAEEKERGE